MRARLFRSSAPSTTAHRLSSGKQMRVCVIRSRCEAIVITIQATAPLLFEEGGVTAADEIRLLIEALRAEPAYAEHSEAIECVIEKMEKLISAEDHSPENVAGQDDQ